MPSPIKTGLSLYRISEITGGDPRAMLDLVRYADAKGIDVVSAPDHVIFASDARDTYPLGPENFPSPLDEPWYDPLTLLAGIATATERIRLSSAILIAPVRPGVLLAKILSTLDAMSGGRVEIVFGAGWQKQEFDACGMPFEGRFTHLEEQIAACRLLWCQAPASFEGKFIRFKDIWCSPFPVQQPIPIWLGLKPSDRNCERMGRLGDGWVTDLADKDYIRSGLDRIHRAMVASGRDPATFQVRAPLMPAYRDDGLIDLDAVFAQAPGLLAAGATMIDVATHLLGRSVAEMQEVIDRLAALKAELG